MIAWLIRFIFGDINFCSHHWEPVEESSKVFWDDESEKKNEVMYKVQLHRCTKCGRPKMFKYSAFF